jgi:hypothetical protein
MILRTLRTRFVPLSLYLQQINFLALIHRKKWNTRNMINCGVVYFVLCAVTATFVIEWEEERVEWSIFASEGVCSVSMCLGKRGVAYSISVVGGTPRRQAFSLKCRIKFLWHAWGAIPVGVLRKQELIHSLRCSKHIVMESNSRLQPRGCIAIDAQLEAAVSSRRQKTNYIHGIQVCNVEVSRQLY